jgi:hypothetical protein
MAAKSGRAGPKGTSEVPRLGNQKERPTVSIGKDGGTQSLHQRSHDAPRGAKAQTESNRNLASRIERPSELDSEATNIRLHAFDPAEV